MKWPQKVGHLLGAFLHPSDFAYHYKMVNCSEQIFLFGERCNILEPFEPSGLLKQFKMFGFKKNKEYDFDLLLEERAIFLSVLTALMQILKSSGNNAQSTFIYNLIELFNQNNFIGFVNLINGVDMWGGAGAVWEVYIEDKAKANKFEKEMLGLINLMEKTKIIGSGIKSIKKIFENNLKTE